MQSTPFFQVNHTFIHVQHTGAKQAVENLVVVFAAADDPGVPEHGEVFGNRGHIRADQFLQFADAVFLLVQPVQDEEPGGMGQGLHNGGHLGIFGVSGRHFSSSMVFIVTYFAKQPNTVKAFLA
jgi:hypothetical protein